MKKQSPILCELQAVDLTLQLAGRERPSGFRCALNGDRRGLPALPVEQIDHAVRVAEIVNRIRPDHVRRTIALAMCVVGGEPAYHRRGIAKMLNVSEKSVSRWLANGLRQVEAAFRGEFHVKVALGAMSRILTISL